MFKLMKCLDDWYNMYAVQEKKIWIKNPKTDIFFFDICLRHRNIKEASWVTVCTLCSLHRDILQGAHWQESFSKKHIGKESFYQRSILAKSHFIKEEFWQRVILANKFFTTFNFTRGKWQMGIFANEPFCKWTFCK